MLSAEGSSIPYTRLESYGVHQLGCSQVPFRDGRRASPSVTMSRTSLLRVENDDHETLKHHM